MTLKIWNLKNELIYKEENLIDLLKCYGIEAAYLDTDNQEEFENEVLGDIYDREGIDSSITFYEIADHDGHTQSIYINEGNWKD